MDKYIVKKTDSFYYNKGNTDYFNYDSKIFAIQSLLGNPSMASYDCKTNTFTEYKPLKYVEKVENVSGHTWFTSLYLIDCNTYEYTIRKFPYYICEIDGNAICSCMNDENIYIFHSEAEGYDTGLFIYSIKDDKFNTEDFFKTKKEFDYIDGKHIEEIYSNKFTCLHDDTIFSCCFKDKLYLSSWNDKIYTLEDNKLTNVTEDKEGKRGIHYLTYWKDNIVGITLRHKDSYVYLNGNKYMKLEDDKLVCHYNVTDDKLFLLLQNYVNNYGQIYEEIPNRIEYEILIIDLK
jgi:hypothetical protein